jgi:hypothetical protein
MPQSQTGIYFSTVSSSETNQDLVTFRKKMISQGQQPESLVLPRGTL